MADAVRDFLRARLLTLMYDWAYVHGIPSKSLFEYNDTSCMTNFNNTRSDIKISIKRTITKIMDRQKLCCLA